MSAAFVKPGQTPRRGDINPGAWLKPSNAEVGAIHLPARVREVEATMERLADRVVRARAPVGAVAAELDTGTVTGLHGLPAGIERNEAGDA